MISVYTGLPRQGKTLNLVYDVVRHMRYGRKVISNTPIWCYVKGRKVFADFYENADEFKFYFLNASRAILVVDEASLYFSSLKWSNLSMDFFAKFRQAGKMGCDLYATSQAWIDTVNSLRRVVDYTMVCKKRRWIFPVPLDLRHEVYDKKKGFYVTKGMLIGLPMVYHMLKVSPGYFSSRAELPEHRRRYIFGDRILYPSQFRYYSGLYDHEYMITSSAVSKLSMFGQYKTFEDYQNANEKKTRVVNGKAKSLVPSVDDAAQPVASATPLSG